MSAQHTPGEKLRDAYTNAVAVRGRAEAEYRSYTCDGFNAWSRGIARDSLADARAAVTKALAALKAAKGE